MRRFFRIAPAEATALARSRELRVNATDAEGKLWGALRDRRLAGRKFRRQARKEPFIVDFVCQQEKLIVEVDGGQHHEQQAYDTRRTRLLAGQKYRVVRFWNTDVLENLDGVLSNILACFGSR
ncbi:MAG: DUF559 domain-containing protein [Candidatus Binataceae bacterium]